MSVKRAAVAVNTPVPRESEEERTQRTRENKKWGDDFETKIEEPESLQKQTVRAPTLPSPGGMPAKRGVVPFAML